MYTVDSNTTTENGFKKCNRYCEGREKQNHIKCSTKNR